MTPLELSLAVVGGCVLFLYPTNGPTAWLRERIVRPVSSRLRVEGLCDCAKCLSFWIGLGFGIWLGPWWVCFTSPAMIWFGQSFTGGKIR